MRQKISINVAELSFNDLETGIGEAIQFLKFYQHRCKDDYTNVRLAIEKDHSGYPKRFNIFADRFELGHEEAERLEYEEFRRLKKKFEGK